jgi:hypothetical protein
MPISVQIKPTINGYPHPSKILPFAESFKTVGDITDGTPTDFGFTTPVYLMAGQEYAISILTNSINVSVDTAIMGDPLDGETGTDPLRATKQPSVRRLFKMQSGSTVSKTDIESIRFVLHACKFTTNTARDINLKNIYDERYGSNQLTVDNYFLRMSNALPPSTVIDFAENGIFGGGASYDPISNERILTPVSVVSGISVLDFTKPRATLITQNEFVSPLIDLHASAVVAVENTVTTTTTQESLAAPTTMTPRYITKRVVLERGMEANNLRVTLSLNNYSQSGGTNAIQVWAKLAYSDNYESFDSLPYIQLDGVPTQSLNENDYRDVTYSFTTDKADFRAFSVKIVLISSDGRFVPRVKNMRIVAV